MLHVQKYPPDDDLVRSKHVEVNLIVQLHLVGLFHVTVVTF